MQPLQNAVAAADCAVQHNDFFWGNEEVVGQMVKHGLIMLKGGVMNGSAAGAGPASRAWVAFGMMSPHDSFVVHMAK